MTASLPPKLLQDPAVDSFAGLDSTAQLMTRFTAQLTTQLRSIRPVPPAAPGPSAGADSPVLVAVAHGSRDPAARRTVERLLAHVRALRPGLRVELGHIELDAPLLSDTLASLPAGSEAVLVPLLFGRGHHVKHDIPRALDAAPHVRASLAGPLGPHPLLVDALHDRLAGAGWGAVPGTGPGEGAVVLASAGSRDPDGVAGAERMAVRLSHRLGGTPVRAAYASAARPGVAETVRELRARGHERVGLASYFAAPGHFAAQCAATPGLTVTAAPLGPHPALARLLLHRHETANRATPTPT